MGKKYTKAQAAATIKYMQDKHIIKVTVPKEKANEYKKVASAAGKSLNKFIIDCIEKELN